MLKYLAAIFAGIVALMALTEPTQAIGFEDARARRAEQAKQEAGRGDEAFGAKNWDEAIEHYTKALDANACGGDCGTYYFRRGVAWLQKEDCGKALADFQKAEETLRDNGELYFNQSRCHSAANQPDLALADLDKALKVNPDSSIYHVGRCIALFNKHDFVAALPDCEFTLQSAPDDQKMLFATAMSAEQTGDKPKAARYYKHLLDLDKGNQQAADGLKRVGG